MIRLVCVRERITRVPVQEGKKGRSEHFQFSHVVMSAGERRVGKSMMVSKRIRFCSIHLRK